MQVTDLLAGPGPVVVAVRDDQPGLVEYAAGEAGRGATSLRVVHAVPPGTADGPTTFDDCLTSDLGALGSIAARRVLDRARSRVRSVAPGLEASFAVEPGPVLAVVGRQPPAVAEVVIGQDGELPQSWWRFDGHPMDRQLAGVTVPVTVVPPAWRDQGGEVMVFLKDLCRSSLAFAVQAAQQRHCVLEVVHLVDASHRDARWGARARLLDGWTAGFPDVDVRVTVVMPGSVAGAVAERAAHASSVVVGVPLRAHVPWGLDGSALRAMVLHAGVSVTFVPRVKAPGAGRA